MPALLGLGCLALSACGDDAVSPEASSPTPETTGGDNAGARDDAGAENDAAPHTPPSCARAAVARTAPTALFDAFTADLGSLTGPARAARVDQLLADVAAQGGAPLEDPASGRVVFLARGAPPAGPWKAAGSFSGWSTAGAVALAAVDGTDLWAGETTIGRGASFEYKLVSGDTFLEDPRAQNVVWDGIDRGFGKRGELNAVGHPGDTPASRGRMVALGKVHAQKLGDDRDVWIHYPAAYDGDACTKLPSIVFHDGLESLTRGGFAQAADALYATRPDLAAVLVFVGLPSQDVRMAQYTVMSDGAKGADYVDFLVDDLAPLVEARARLCSAPAARGVAGASLGGLISTFAGFERPDRFGWIGAQSGSYFWADDAMITRAASEPKKPLRIYLDSGCPDDNCVVTDRLADVLAAKGYDHVRIKQAGASHDWSFWRDRLGGLLTHFRDGQTACD
ncbi:MAG: esterase family protein [Labilithrix sp.]|nr:esterase family protein [Labilithrix sp.]